MTVRPAGLSQSSESRSSTEISKLKCFGTKTLDGPSCLWRFVLPIVEGNEESSRKNFYTSMGRRSPSRSVMTMTVRRVIHRPSQFLSKIVLLLEPTKQVVTTTYLSHIFLLLILLMIFTWEWRIIEIGFYTTRWCMWRNGYVDFQLLALVDSPYLSSIIQKIHTKKWVINVQI